LMFTFMILAAATFRTDRDPAVIQGLSDLFWLLFIGLAGPVIFQFAIIAIAVFIDTGDKPTFPRWLGYLNAWCALLSLPGPLIVLFHDGPLAWNGVVAFWIPLVAFAAWLGAMVVMLLRAITQQANDESSVR